MVYKNTQKKKKKKTIKIPNTSPVPDSLSTGKYCSPFFQMEKKKNLSWRNAINIAYYKIYMILSNTFRSQFYTLNPNLEGEL